MPAFYEFFAGGGMARAGLGEQWQCLFANDFDAKKAASYTGNWGCEHLKVADVATLTTRDVPPGGQLAWASFPCQDLSLAGDGAGLAGNRSSSFWPFWKLIRALGAEQRGPSIVVLENVCGALSSHEGRDFGAIAKALVAAGYRFGAIVADSVHFVPQSRPRLFIVACHKTLRLPGAVTSAESDALWHPPNLIAAWQGLAPRIKAAWIWWKIAAPPARETALCDILEADPRGVKWHSPSQTRSLLAMMNDLHRRKLEQAKATSSPIAGALYRRTRLDRDGKRVQRAEVRFDGISGCLRTPSGGSSRQTILLVDGERVRSRLLSAREAARLMGLPDTYRLPTNYNDAYHLAGDGVAVPVVRFLAEHLLNKLASHG